MNILLLHSDRNEENHPARSLMSRELYPVIVNTTLEAKLWLTANGSDLIIAPLHFHQEELFEFLLWVRENALISNIPFVLHATGQLPPESLLVAAFASRATDVLFMHEWDDSHFCSRLSPYFKCKFHGLLPLPAQIQDSAPGLEQLRSVCSKSS